MFSRSHKAKEIASRIAQHWDERTQTSKPDRFNWWKSPLIRKHINKLVSGKPYARFSQGLLKVVKQRVGSRVFEKGVSVGCGIGNKEMALLRDGLVRSFELYELSGTRIEKGKEIAKKLGVEDRVSFHQEDAFKVVPESSVDFVHWNNSLHHMMDVDAAVAWSYRVLRPEGVFYMDDFVGPTRWQWSDESLAIGTRIRSLLPEKYMRNPHYPEKGEEFMGRELNRPSSRRVARQDPSEAADSERIIESVRKYFPDAEITLTGGLVYHMTLSQILHNFDEEDECDAALLNLLMLIDELCIRVPGLESHYATAFAWKR